jgi:Aspartyl protease
MKSKLQCFPRKSSAAKRAAILATAAAEGVFRSAPALASGRVLRTLLFFLLLLAPMPNHANPGALRLPFRTVQSLILVDGKVGEKRVTLLLDTGSNRTIVSLRSYGGVQLPLRRAQRNRSAAGMKGESVRLPVNLTLADHIWAGQCVTVMNLDELQQVLGIRFDGLLGQDILREFRSVRIDYSAHVIALEYQQSVSSRERDDVSTQLSKEGVVDEHRAAGTPGIRSTGLSREFVQAAC